MDNPTTWIIVGILVLLILVLLFGVISAKTRRKARETANRENAHEARSQAKQDEPAIAEKQERAEHAKAEAERAEDEARAKAKEAEELRTRADRADSVARDAADSQQARLREADSVDPDIPTDAEGRRIDKNGRLISENPGSSPVTGDS